MGSYYALQNTPTVPVSLADAKAFLKIDFTKDDAVITDMIAAAVEWGEAYTGRDFSTKQWLGFFDAPCADYFEPKPYLPLQRSPLTALTSIDTASAGVYSAFTGYINKPRDGFDHVLLTTNVPIDETVAYTFRVTFESGYATLPANIKQAILEHVSFLYENRGDAPSDPPQQVKNLYGKQKLVIGYA
jgi:uncharacterized phiE125 gp8 family phage protein